MKYLFVLLVVTASLATRASADRLEYDLEVNGMVCAFCAYNVSKQLGTLDGVIPDTVDVDLVQGRVTLRSDKELDKSQIADLLLTAGFKLGAVNKADALQDEAPGQRDQAAILSMTMSSDRLSDGQFDEVLEAIGAIAVQRSARISVIGPAKLELAILKPVLMGRRTVIKVDYDRSGSLEQTVAVSVFGNPAMAR